MPEVIGVKDESMEASKTLEKKNGFMIPKKTFTYTAYVLGDDVNTTEDDILSTTGIPTLFSAHNGAYCQGLRASVVSQVRHPITGVLAELWEVTADYDSSLDINEPNGGDDPTDRTPTVEWSSESVDTVLERDVIDGSPIETFNHERILWSRPVIHPILRISRYETYPFNANQQLEYANHINSAQFWGAPEFHALMHPMEVTEEFINGYKYCKVAYTIEFAFLSDNQQIFAGPFKFTPLHQGTLYRTEINGTIQKAKDKEGHPRTVNLDDNGVLLPNDAPPRYRTFNQFPLADFNNLNLGPF